MPDTINQAMGEPNNERQHMTDHTLQFGAARGGGKTATMHAQMDAMRKSIGVLVAGHDPATCWWCLNSGPRKALERSGMVFSEDHSGSVVDESRQLPPALVERIRECVAQASAEDAALQAQVDAHEKIVADYFNGIVE